MCSVGPQYPLISRFVTSHICCQALSTIISVSIFGSCIYRHVYTCLTHHACHFLQLSSILLVICDFEWEFWGPRSGEDDLQAGEEDSMFLQDMVSTYESIWLTTYKNSSHPNKRFSNKFSVDSVIFTLFLQETLSPCLQSQIRKLRGKRSAHFCWIENYCWFWSWKISSQYRIWHGIPLTTIRSIL